MITAVRFPALPISAILIALADAAPACAQDAASASELYLERTFSFTGGPYRDHPFPYRLLLPVDHEAGAKSAGKSWPLIVFLHGAGERGDDNRAQLKYFPEQMATAENRDRHRAFIVAPQCPRERWWAPLNRRTLEAEPAADPAPEARAVLAIIDRLLEEFPIDPRRLYLTGLSMGGYGTWDLAARHPERWAAAAPICGGGSPVNASRLKDLPLWAFHGARDPVVPLRRTVEMVEAIRAAGGSPRYTEFPDAGHDSWTPAYAHPEFLPWLFVQRRASLRF